MRNFKAMVKALYKALQVLETSENKALIIKFGENLRENVQIVMDIAAPLAEIVGYDLSFKSRGVNNALLADICAELAAEEAQCQPTT